MNERRPLPHDGTDQDQRISPALDPSYFLIDDATFEDRLALVAELAKHIRLDSPGAALPSGNWSSLFSLPPPSSPEEADDQTRVARYWANEARFLESRSDNPPHLALFLAFLRLLRHPQDQLNALTKRHLDFYYREVLRFQPKPPEPDHVHVTFELAKGITRYRIEQGTELDAGQDDRGNDLIYRTNDEIVVNRARIASLKSVYVEPGSPSRVFSAEVANSADGQGDEIRTEPPAWDPFGKSQRDFEPGDRTMADARLGFAVASPLLLMREGQRDITLRASSLNNPLGLAVSGRERFVAWLSGEEAWIGPITVTVTASLSVALQSDGSTKEVTETTLILDIQLTADEPEVAPYQERALGAGFDVPWPVLRIELDTANPQHDYDAVLHNLQTLSLHVSVKHLSPDALRNDFGPLDSNSPFDPFGPNPAIGSAFYLGDSELRQKPVNSLNVRLPWMGVPAKSLGEHYQAYGPSTLTNSDFKATVSHRKNDVWQEVNEEQLFVKNDATAEHEGKLLKVSPGLAAELKIELTAPKSTDFQAFGHRKFQRLLTQLTQQIATKEAAQPRAAKELADLKTRLADLKSPYTPRLQSIRIDYTASERLSFESEIVNDKNATEKQRGNKLRFFHLEPFGVNEVYTHNTTAKKITLLPSFDDEGSLFLGVADLDPPQNLRVLFQAAQYTANPQPDGPREIKWAYLANDRWRSFDVTRVDDQTRNFTQSGIVSLAIPEDAGTIHARMPDGYVWIRATLHVGVADVCRMIDVRSQALKASLVIGDRVPSHLSEGLPVGSIVNLKQPQREIKNVSQPFASWGGCAEETDERFYTRVSERLRHKNRAVTRWDYEHLVLEAFPDIYKVECLPHFQSPNRNSAPGHVTLVVVPRLPTEGVLQPRATRTTLLEIEEYITAHCSPFVNAAQPGQRLQRLHVQNAEYETLTVQCRVRFQPGKSFRFYQEKLEQELVRFLSPWSFGDSDRPMLGNSLHRSVVEAFIRERPYVDFFVEFEMLHQVGDKTPGKTPEANARLHAILVSARHHFIVPIDSFESEPSANISPQSF